LGIYLLNILPDNHPVMLDVMEVVDPEKEIILNVTVPLIDAKLSDSKLSLPVPPEGTAQSEQIKSNVKKETEASKKSKTTQDSKNSQQVVVQAKKNTNGGSTRPEALNRLHHLYKAAHAVSSSIGPGGHTKRVLSAHYTGLLVGVAKKSVLRLTPDVKRTICKGCRSLLLINDHQQLSVKVVKKSGGHIQVGCPKCRAVKNFPLKPKKPKV